MEPYFEGVRLGMPQHRAANLAGMHQDTVRKARSLSWFIDAEKRAEAACIQRRLDRIDRAGEGGAVLSRKTTTKTNARTGEEIVLVEESFTRPEWQADGWTLERRFPDDFAKKDATEGQRTVNFYVNGTPINPV